MSASPAPDERARIFLLGGSGQIGWELVRALAPLGQLIAPSRDELDLTDGAALSRTLRAVAPALIVNAAAFTDVDGAEKSETMAQAVNAQAPRILAEEAARLNAPLVHYSTDYVFDGTAHRPYRESDVPAPLGAYGRSKLAGERAVMESDAAHLVLRTSWIYSRRGRNFLNTIEKLAHDQNELRVVSDQTGCPTWARMVAIASSTILSRCWRRGSGDPLSGTGGLYHLAAAGETSWHGFAEAIVALLPGELSRKPVRAITTAEYPRPAKRPAYSVLDSRKALDAFGIMLPHWRDQLALCLADKA